MVHETILDLAFLFTIRSNDLIMTNPFPLGSESFSGLPMLPLSMSMEAWEVDLPIKFALPVRQIISDSVASKYVKINKGHVMISHMVVLKQPTI